MRHTQMMNSIHRAVSFSLLAVLALFAPAASAQGTITGTVLDAANQPVGGATLYYNNVPPLSTAGQPIGQVIRSTVVANSSGAFRISGLPLGQYRVCARGTLSNQLPSCDWGLPLATIGLTDAAPVATVALTLGDGCLIKLTINDPNGLVQDRVVGVPAGSVAAGNMSFGVMNSGRYEPARLLSVGGGTRTYYVAVPKNSTYSVVMSTSLILSGPAALGAGPSQEAMTVTTGTSDVSVYLGTVY